MHLLGKRKLIVAALTALVLGVVGLVYAAWTSNGTGSAYAKASTAQALTTVDVSTQTTATLYPGATGDLLIKISNPNPYPVKVTDVTGNGAITADTGHSTCGADAQHPSGVTFTDQHALTISVPANSSTQTTLSGSVLMSSASDNSCQGATFTVPVTLAGVSA
jgi:hypothetical protein